MGEKIFLSFKEVDFSESIDVKDELFFDEGKINVLLFLGDRQYENLVNRTALVENSGRESLEDIIDNTDDTLSVYVDLKVGDLFSGDLTGDLTNDCSVIATLVHERNTSNIEYEVPLTETEKKCLINTIDKIGREQGVSIENYFKEASSKINKDIFER